jgi:hypothetical protein
MSDLTFSHDEALAIYNSTEEFPVNFDAAWVWLNYSSKGNAKVHFMKCNFVKGIDYSILTKKEENSNGGRPTEKIFMTVDCFKKWALRLDTELSRKLVDYLLNCERLAQQNINLQVIGQNLSKSAASRTGFVYLIKAETTSFYKIGKSKDVHKRLESLQSGNNTELTIVYRIFSTNYSTLERQLHKYYEPYWVRGEWFDFPVEIVNQFLSVANLLEDTEEIKTLTPESI